MHGCFFKANHHTHLQILSNTLKWTFKWRNPGQSFFFYLTICTNNVPHSESSLYIWQPFCVATKWLIEQLQILVNLSTVKNHSYMKRNYIIMLKPTMISSTHAETVHSTSVKFHMPKNVLRWSVILNSLYWLCALAFREMWFIDCSCMHVCPCPPVSKKTLLTLLRNAICYAPFAAGLYNQWVELRIYMYCTEPYIHAGTGHILSLQNGRNRFAVCSCQPHPNLDRMSLDWMSESGNGKTSSDRQVCWVGVRLHLVEV